MSNHKDQGMANKGWTIRKIMGAGGGGGGGGGGADDVQKNICAKEILMKKIHGHRVALK